MSRSHTYEPVCKRLIGSELRQRSRRRPKQLIQQGFSSNQWVTVLAQNSAMTDERESFVIWIDAKSAGRGELSGAAEWTRASQRGEFGSLAELGRFFERCVATSIGDSRNRGDGHRGRTAAGSPSGSGPNKKLETEPKNRSEARPETGVEE